MCIRDSKLYDMAPYLLDALDDLLTELALYEDGGDSVDWNSNIRPAIKQAAQVIAKATE